MHVQQNDDEQDCLLI